MWLRFSGRGFLFELDVFLEACEAVILPQTSGNAEKAHPSKQKQGQTSSAAYSAEAKLSSEKQSAFKTRARDWKLVSYS